jgi:hypothetical protein
MRGSGGTPASTWFHRALVMLIPAASLSWLAYQYRFHWLLTLAAIAFWAAGIFLLKRGSDRLRTEGRRRG